MTLVLAIPEMISVRDGARCCHQFDDEVVDRIYS